jgi:hypothetical protein
MSSLLNLNFRFSFLVRRLLILLFLSVGTFHAALAQTEEGAIKALVESFLNGYVQSVERSLSGQHEAEEGWIYKNRETTKKFKDAYRRMEKAAMKRLEEDPGDSGADFITLWAGDVPSATYSLGSVKVAGSRATATARNKEKGAPTIKLILVNQNGNWVIDSINGVNRRK